MNSPPCAWVWNDWGRRACWGVCEGSKMEWEFWRQANLDSVGTCCFLGWTSD